MEEEKNKQEEKELLYNTRSEEAQEIIGSMPHWVIRWGITVIGLFLLMIFGVAAIVKYPETVSAQIVLSPLQPPVIISSKENGLLKSLQVTDSQYVSKSQILATLEADSSGKLQDIQSPGEGILYYMSDIRPPMHIKQKEPLFTIIQNDNNANQMKAMGIVDATQRNNLHIGQTITIKLTNYPSENYGTIQGEIYKIAPVAVNGNYIINFHLKEGLITSNQYEIPLKDRLTGTGDIIIKEKTVLRRLLEKLKL